MKARFILALAALAGSTAFALVAPEPASAQARDWTRTVVTTPEGGFRMGNPNAKVKLVEYGSLTCPHCAHFSAEAKAPLAAYVRSGKVSYEFRNYVLNGIDIAATLVARCAAPASFFRLTESLYATQRQWVGRISGISQAEKDKLAGLSDGARLGRLADIGGITQLAAQAGLAPARAKQCLGDPAALDTLDRLAAAAEAQGVSGTPTFFYNDANIGSHDWHSLEPILREGVG